MSSADLRRCLESCDVAGARLLWASTAPHLHQPKTDHEALTTIHMARTRSDSIALKLRAYSHRWLLDQGYPSGLPDELKPKAERLYPKIVGSVGISMNSRSELMQPIAKRIERAVSDTVNEIYADNANPSIELVKSKMKITYDNQRKFFRELFESPLR